MPEDECGPLFTEMEAGQLLLFAIKREVGRLEELLNSGVDFLEALEQTIGEFAKQPNSPSE